MFSRPNIQKEFYYYSDKQQNTIHKGKVLFIYPQLNGNIHYHYNDNKPQDSKEFPFSQ